MQALGLQSGLGRGQHAGGGPAQARWGGHSGSGRRRVNHGYAARPSVRAAAMPEWLRKIADFSSWAPKSSRIWRLQEFEITDEDEEKPNEVDESINDLQARAQQMAKDSGPGGASPAYASNAGPGPMAASSEAPGPDSTKSFSEVDDSELAQAFRARLQSMSTSSSEEEEEEASPAPGEAATAAAAAAASAAGLARGGGEDEEEVEPITGEELRDLILEKYGKQYDVSFARRDMPGKAFVCLNIMWQHREQRSFKMSEAQYNDKVDSVAYMVNVLGQTERVRGFLMERARSKGGLPRRPIVGTAISIQLDLTPDVVADFFGTGYY